MDVIINCSCLTGKGIDYNHPDFRNQDGSTRILALYDETLDREFTSEEINQMLWEGKTDLPGKRRSEPGRGI